MEKPIAVTHVITGLRTGGAEMMLYRLLSRIDVNRFSSHVISLTSDGPMGEKIRSLGVPTRILGMHPDFPNPALFFRLAGWLRAERPAIVQTWMYNSDLIGGLAAWLAGRIPVVWGLHNSSLDPKLSKRSTIWTMHVLAWLSRLLPVKIISCSEAARQLHIQRGYEARKFVLIPNGFDVQVYQPAPVARLSVRQELELEPATRLIGYVARFDPQKDHATFIQAAAIMHQCMPNIHFLLAGDGITWENKRLVGWVDSTGLRHVVHLLGRREDTPRLMAALDLATITSSYGEAFPLTVGEAMSCGVPCVVTDVGDSAFLVGDTGIVVQPRDSQALADGWRKLVELGAEGRQKLGQAARQRIEAHFNLDCIVDKYQTLYLEIVK